LAYSVEKLLTAGGLKILGRWMSGESKAATRWRLVTMFRHSRSGFVCCVDCGRLSVAGTFAGEIVGAGKMSFSTE
jgi:hypothetical protein